MRERSMLVALPRLPYEKNQQRLTLHQPTMNFALFCFFVLFVVKTSSLALGSNMSNCLI